MEVTFEIHQDGKTVGTATRSVRNHVGWQSVRYGGKRYQLFGGIRTNYFINANRPIKSTRVKKGN